MDGEPIGDEALIQVQVFHAGIGIEPTFSPLILDGPLYMAYLAQLCAMQQESNRAAETLHAMVIRTQKRIRKVIRSQECLLREMRRIQEEREREREDNPFDIPPHLRDDDTEDTD